MNKLPIRLNPTPIAEATIELRITATSSVEAMIGLLYSKLITILPELTRLPASLFPTQVPQKDPNLIYLAHYTFSKANLQTRIGPKVIAFVNIEPYVGWVDFSAFVGEMVQKIRELGLVQTVDRIGLRYVNLFKERILDKINFELVANKVPIVDQPTYLRTEFRDRDRVQLVQIANEVDVRTSTYAGQASLLDIDCSYNVQLEAETFFDSYRSVLEELHESEKSRFFSLLTPEFLERFHPVY